MIISIMAREYTEKTLSAEGTGRKPGLAQQNRPILGSLDVHKSLLDFGTLFMFSASNYALALN